MERARDSILASIEHGDREASVRSSMDWLTSGAGDIVTLYEKVLAPYLNGIGDEPATSESIWREHLRSSIVRTIIESCYPLVLKERERRRPSPNGRAVVVCTDDELHELGARMVSDFLTICGFEATFIGANTPKEVVISAVRDLAPTVVAISVTNFFNISVASDTIKLIRGSNSSKVKVIVGGRAFKRNPNACFLVGADAQLDSFEDIKKMFGGA